VTVFRRLDFNRCFDVVCFPPKNFLSSRGAPRSLPVPDSTDRRTAKRHVGRCIAPLPPTVPLAHPAWRRLASARTDLIV